MTLRKKQIYKKKHLKKYGKDYVKIVLVLIFLLFIFRKPIIYSSVLNLFSTEKTYAYIIDEKNYERRGHLTDSFTYSYEFDYDGTTYNENSNVRGMKVGDKIKVEFNKYFPFINRILK
ncbi:hypothetical protein [Flavobacterium hungaricum]|uniref:DUF3592 domain-containing protein n=1 Tax=Flavobacterium hungaricum TaxID=2082725 RepID=A0ABR9TPB9_9FLAO|nr:hypothetical protein [Flavobacterium hungaricum]MBE8726487.1 hypothetical protein [Flavobacterium hungaricum]